MDGRALCDRPLVVSICQAICCGLLLIVETVRIQELSVYRSEAIFAKECSSLPRAFSHGDRLIL